MYSRVLNKHVGLNKSIGRKIMENQMIVLVGINMLVGWSNKRVGMERQNAKALKTNFIRCTIRVQQGLIRKFSIFLCF